MVDVPLVGIDLGTTHSLVAVFEGDTPRVLPQLDGRPLLPSVVALDASGRLLVGAPAADRLVVDPRSAVARFKPEMGSDRRFTLGANELRSTSLSALVLRELRDAAEAALGAALGPVVITVPAWFGEPQRRATLEAGALAGLDVRSLLNEPTAAALAYGLGLDPEPRVVAVLDLGGGTFDVTVLELFHGVVDVLGTHGDAHLGGEDYTDALLREARRLGGVVALDAALEGRARALAERAKRVLSQQDSTLLDLSAHGGPCLDVSRDAFAAWSEPLTRRLVQCVREALARAGVRAAQVDEVLLVGGATRMPLVQETAAALFGREPSRADALDEVVARGAAVHAALLARHEALRERLLTDVLTHSLGVAVRRRWGEKELNDRFDPILARGTTLPAARTETYTTVQHDQREVVIQVYEGEQRRASDNHLLAKLRVTDLPVHDDEGARESFEVRFVQDTSGLLEVEAKVISTGQAVRVVVERAGTSLDEGAREEAMAQIARLRTHPRDLLPNRYVIERANRLVCLLSGADRRHLDDLLTAFELALDAEAPEQVDYLRERLTAACRGVARKHDLDPDGP